MLHLFVQNVCFKQFDLIVKDRCVLYLFVQNVCVKQFDLIV